MISNHFQFSMDIKIFGRSRSINVGIPYADSHAVPSNTFRFKLSNFGQGAAKDFRIWLKLDVIDEDSEYNGGWSRPGLSRLDRLSLYKFAENTMPAGQENVEFEGSVELKLIDPPEDKSEIRAFSTVEFPEAAETLYQNDVEFIRIRWLLKYKDTFGEEYADEFFSKESKLEENMTFQQFMSAESPTVVFENTSSNVWNK
jgi:hypothetical protein